MDIRFQFINRSHVAVDHNVVIFQKNIATTFQDIAVAWKVIRTAGRGDTHPFAYPHTMQVYARDSWGNCTPPQLATYGQRFVMQRASSGDVLVASGSASRPDIIEVINTLNSGAIDAVVLRDGRSLAVWTGLSPQEKASFQFAPAILIGVIPGVEEGEVMPVSVFSGLETELPLLGIASADIVLTGDGAGQCPSPFEFTLHNVQKA